MTTTTMMMILRVVLFVGVLGVLSAGETAYRCSGAIYTRSNSGRMSWNDAQNACRQSNAMLPIVSDQQRQSCFASALKNFNVNTSAESVWIGANTSGDRGLWRWVNGSLYGGTGENPSPNVTYQSDYAYIDVISEYDTKIFLTKPTVNLPFICRYNGVDYGRCSNALRGIYYAGDCFVKNESNVSWFGAWNSCLQNKGDLAFFDDLHLFDNRLIDHAYWIGLRRSAWNWNYAVNGSTTEVTYTLWSSGQPDGNGSQCISTDTSGDVISWKDSNCNDNASFICQGDQLPPSSPSPAAGSSAAPPSSPSPATGFSSAPSSSPSPSTAFSSVPSSSPSPSTAFSSVPSSSPSPATGSSAVPSSSPSSATGFSSVPSSSPSPAAGFSGDKVPSSSPSPATFFPSLSPASVSESPEDTTDSAASESQDLSNNHGSGNRSLIIALGVGIGVGLGVPFLLGVIALIVAIVVMCRRHRKSRTKPKPDRSKQNKEDVEMNKSSSSVPHKESYGAANKGNHEEQLPPYTPTEEHHTELETSARSVPLANNYGTANEETSDPLPSYSRTEEEPEFPTPLEPESYPSVPHDESYGVDNMGTDDQSPPFYPTEEDPELETSSPSFPQEISEEHYGIVDNENHEQLDPPSPYEPSNLPPFPEGASGEHYDFASSENHEQPAYSTPYEPSDPTVDYAEFNFNST